MDKIDTRINCLDDIKNRIIALGKTPKIAVASAHDDDVLESLNQAIEQDIATAILIGDEKEIIKIAKSINFNISKVEIIDVKDDVEAAKIAVKLVRDKKCDVLMKGLTPTSTLLKEALNKETGIRGSGVLSHIALFETDTYHKLIAGTDCAVNISPKREIFEKIIYNSVHALHKLDYGIVKTCLISASEKPNPKIPESTMYTEIVDSLKIENAIIEGPYAIDNAVDKDSCKIKGIKGETAGDADLLVFPNLIAGNVFYKSMIFLGKAKVAGCVIGAAKPIVLTSRSDSSDSKFNSICLAMYLATKE